MIASLTPRLLCNTFTQRRGVQSERWAENGRIISGARLPLAPFPPRGHSCCRQRRAELTRLRAFLSFVFFFPSPWAANSGVRRLSWWHSVMPLVHTHIICCVRLIHVQCRYEDQRCVPALDVPVFTVGLNQLPQTDRQTLGRPCSACMCEDCTCCIYKFSVPASVQRAHTHTFAASPPPFFSAWMRHYSIFQHKV